MTFRKIIAVYSQKHIEYKRGEWKLWSSWMLQRAITYIFKCVLKNKTIEITMFTNSVRFWRRHRIWNYLIHGFNHTLALQIIKNQLNTTFRKQNRSADRRVITPQMFFNKRRWAVHELYYFKRCEVSDCSNQAGVMYNICMRKSRTVLVCVGRVLVSGG